VRASGHQTARDPDGAVLINLARSAGDRQMENVLSQDEATTPSQMRLKYGPDRYDRLARIKRRFDPDNMLRNNYNIPPAS
jgi:FAD/FMN-containing dehydrogenase